MATQKTFFDNTIPPCRHCGGVGQWEDAGFSSFFIGDKLKRLACTKCTFQTDGVSLTAEGEQTLRAWIMGVPCCVHDTTKHRTMRLNEYYKSFSPPTMARKATAQIYGISWLLFGKITSSITGYKRNYRPVRSGDSS